MKNHPAVFVKITKSRSADRIQIVFVKVIRDTIVSVKKTKNKNFEYFCEGDKKNHTFCLFVCVCVCVRACVRACMCVCVLGGGGEMSDNNV